MRILLDHCMPEKFRVLLPGHEVATTAEMGWESLTNGNLLRAAAARFDVILTVDKGIRHQQNLRALPLAVILIRAKSNSLASLEAFAVAIEAALAVLQPRQLVEVTTPGPQ